MRERDRKRKREKKALPDGIKGADTSNPKRKKQRKKERKKINKLWMPMACVG